MFVLVLVIASLMRRLVTTLLVHDLAGEPTRGGEDDDLRRTDEGSH